MARGASATLRISVEGRRIAVTAGASSIDRAIVDTPAGAKVRVRDVEGFVRSAEVHGGRLARFAPDGTIERLVGMPVDSITSVMFGGADLDILYVTSMARPFGGRRRQEREAGGLFAVHGLGVRGVPELRFKG